MSLNKQNKTVRKMGSPCLISIPNIVNCAGSYCCTSYHHSDHLQHWFWTHRDL